MFEMFVPPEGFAFDIDTATANCTSSPDSVFSSSSSPISSPPNRSPVSPPQDFTPNPLSSSTYLFNEIFAPPTQQQACHQVAAPTTANSIIVDASAHTKSENMFDFSTIQADVSLYDPTFLVGLQQQFQPVSNLLVQQPALSSSNGSIPLDSSPSAPAKKRVRESVSSSSEDEGDQSSSGFSMLPNIAPGAHFSALSKEQVLKLTSKEIEQYVANLKATRLLSQSEERELKKQRRLIKNREYASQSRSRKKNMQEALEKKLEDRSAEVDSLRADNDRLKIENDALKRQLAGITVTIKNSPSLASLFSIGGSIPHRSRGVSRASGTAATACLLAVLCVFSLTAFTGPADHAFLGGAPQFDDAGVRVRPTTRILLDADVQQPSLAWDWAAGVYRNCTHTTLAFSAAYLPASFTAFLTSLSSSSSVAPADGSEYVFKTMPIVQAASRHAQSAQSAMATLHSAAPNRDQLSGDKPTGSVHTGKEL